MVLVQKTIKNIYLGGTDEWKPNENTVLRLPLNSTDQYTDKSLSPHTFSNSGVEFGINAGVDCAYFSQDRLYTSAMTIENEFTISWWCYRTSRSGNRSVFSDVTENGFATTFKIGVIDTIGSETVSDYGGAISGTSGGATQVGTATNLNLNQWYHCVETRRQDTNDSSIRHIRYYLNGEEDYGYDGGRQRDWNTRQGGKYVGWDCYYTAQGSDRYYYGYLSNLIIENGARSADDIAAYYDQTKSLYGIS